MNKVVAKEVYIRPDGTEKVVWKKEFDTIDEMNQTLELYEALCETMQSEDLDGEFVIRCEN